ncbi:MAG: hypothetical protein HY703_12555 [Gemmatimonadetes bacterium]|nr:hypothetical protein [Gemmatimonadota bacterium]
MLLAATMLLAPAGQLRAGWAQEAEQSEATAYRRWVLALVGAAVATVPALLTKEKEDARGACQSKACLTALAATMGASAGFLIGRERDQAAARRNAGGPTLKLETRAVELDLLPERLTAYQGGAVVVGREGMAAVQQDGRINRLAGDMRGVQAAAGLPAHDALLAATASGVFSFPLRDRAPGRLVLQQGGAALEPMGADQVALGGGALLRRLKLTGQGAMLQLEEEARAASPGAFTALAYSPFAGVLWNLSHDRLVARSAAGFEEVGSVTLPAGGRSLSLSGGRALVAAGSQGVFLLDISQPDAPRIMSQVQGLRFAFDAVLEGDRAYVALGRQGLLVIDVSDVAHPRTIGVARNLGFVSEVDLAGAGKVYALDREGGRLFTVDTGAAAAASSGRE